MSLELTQYLEAAHLRQVQVEKDEIRRWGFQELAPPIQKVECLLSVFHFVQVMI